MSKNILTGYYGVYSQTQFENLSIRSGFQDDKCKSPYIYYKNINDKIVQVTEVFNDSNKKSLFKDAVYLGELKVFHGLGLQPFKE